MSEEKNTGDHYQVNIGGPVGGQVAIGKNINQTQTNVTTAPEVSPEEARTPPETKDNAFEQAEALEENAPSAKPGLITPEPDSSPRAPEAVKLLKIVVASPGDVQAERDVIEAVAAELNRGVAADRGLRLDVVRWETDTYPGFHPQGPQGLIDPILRIEDSDLLIGIFWRRFGTPTEDAQSGTEHEIRKAYGAWRRSGRPQIMVYFNQEPYTPRSVTETDQWGQVLTFKNTFPKEGLWWEYTGHEAFEDLIRTHLTHHIRQRYQLRGPS